ncbi:MAG: ankyrin repeat domain-containing protein [Sphaerochaetaceae bacterium]|nr:ankyrin repeat domain-containing protein [Sphaerochaetaceae bacterium]
MNFYKILNKTENHYGLKYKSGLNIDPIEFNPYGTCEPGGIYFSREDILAFLDYGPWIRKVTLPEDAQVYENPGKIRKWKADKVILGERELITTTVVKRLIEEGADPNTCNSWPLRCAAEFGHLDIVKLLLPLSDVNTRDSEALRWATANGHLEIVKLLLPYSDPKIYDSEALMYATKNGHFEIVKLLLPYSNPKASDSVSLRYAAEKGYLDIVKLLIPHSEINDCVINYCRRYCENQEILDLIIPNKN